MRVKVWPIGVMKVDGSKVRGNCYEAEALVVREGILGDTWRCFNDLPLNKILDHMMEAHAIVGIMAMGLVVSTEEGFVEIWGQGIW